MTYRCRIAGTGSYLPEKLLSNADLEKLVETNDDWIYERTGIRNRAMAADDQNTTDLARNAALQAMRQAKVEPSQIDAILFATVSPDAVMPSSACILQRKLGAKKGLAVDLSAACSGFVYGLAIANDFIVAGSYKCVLVVGAEILHHYVDYKDRDTCILFGDGAGAVIVKRAEGEAEEDGSRIYSHHLHADGGLGDLLELDLGDDYMRMKGREIFKHAVRAMTECCTEALDHNKMSANDVDWVIPHQANIRIIEGVAKHFGIPMSKVIVEIENMGNTSAATIPVALDKAVRDGRIRRGQNVLLTAFGAGLTSGSLLMRY